MTTLGILGAVAVIPLVVAGPRLGAAIGRPLGLGEAFATLWRVGYWPGVGLLGFAVLTTFYHFAPSWRTPWRREVPGAVAALLVWLAGGAALRLYAIISIQGASAYRGLAAPIVLLLWIYITALAVLVGAELNAEIERAYPTIDGPSGPLAQANAPATSTSASPSQSEPHTPRDSEGRTV
jgi:membrane protein